MRRSVRIDNYMGSCIECGRKAFIRGVKLDEDGLPEDNSLLDKLYCWRCRHKMGLDATGRELSAATSMFIPGSIKRLEAAERKIRKAIAANIRYYGRAEAKAMLAAGEITHISKCRLVGSMTPPDSAA